MTLLGDAAHPMFPFFAQGAAQAIEDGAALARCLAADPADPAAALRRYESLRIPRTTRLQGSATPAPTSTTCPTARSSRPATPRSPASTRWRPARWIYAHDPESEPTSA